MNGDVLKNDLTNDNTKVTTLTRMTKYEAPDSSYLISEVKDSETWYDPTTMAVLEGVEAINAALTTYKYAYCEKTYTEAGTATGSVSGRKIEINAANFPGTYRVVGETFARSQATGKDEYFQFEIPKAKMGAENTITLEAEGDPSVFNMTMKVLRPESGPMIILRQYNLTEATVDPDAGTATINTVTLIEEGEEAIPNKSATVQLGSTNLPVLVASDLPEGKQVVGWYSDAAGTTEFTVPTGGWTRQNVTTVGTIYAKLENA